MDLLLIGGLFVLCSHLPHMCVRAFGNLCRAVLGAIVYILAAPAVGWSDF